MPADPSPPSPPAPGGGAAVPLLGGPTASGKSAWALELAAARGDVEIVAADAMQVYRGMDLGTAKASAAERARIAHHGLDLVSPAEAFSVADWTRAAVAAVERVRARGRVPLVVGGTGFYLQALTRGVPTVPEADPARQAPLWTRLERDGLGALVAELERRAPEDAARAQRNPRRVVRALEVLGRTGKPPSAFGFRRPPFAVRMAALLPEVAALRPRIAARTEAMFAAGLVAEVRALLARWPEPPTALQAIGYKEVAAHLRGETTLAEAKAAVELATVQYAKRQRTWFAKEVRRGRADPFAGTAEAVAGKLTGWFDAVVGTAAG